MDLSTLSGNQFAVSGLAVSGQVTPPLPPSPQKKKKRQREKKERDQKYHRAYIRKRLLVAPEIWAMSPPILLRTDGQPLRTGTRIIVSRKSSTFWYQHLPKTGLPGLFLHHNNASAHTAATTIDVLKERDVQLLPHPPYSHTQKKTKNKKQLYLKKQLVGA